MGKGKRKASGVQADEQPPALDVGLVTDTDFHTGAAHALTFQQIFEFYRSAAELEDENDAEVWRNVKRSCIHLLAARPALLPWHDMTRWVLSRCHAKGIISKADGSNLVSFASGNVANIYVLPTPEHVVDDAYLKAFNEEHPDINDWLQEWWYDDRDFKPTSHRTCRIQDFGKSYRPVAMMICRLMGEKNCNIFRKKWVPIMHAAAEEGRILNWASMLAEVMQKELRKHIEAPEEAKPPFYMSAYLLDMAIAQINFPDVGLNWVSNPIPIHELFSILWADHYIPHFYTICDKIMPRVYTILFGQAPRRISADAALTIKRLGHWFLEDFFTIIRIFGNEEASYLPSYVPDKLALREIAQQTVGVGAFARLHKHGKKTWPDFPVKIGKLTL